MAGRGVLQGLAPRQVVTQHWEGAALRPRYFRLMDPSMPARTLPVRI